MDRGRLGIDLIDLWPNWRAYIAMHKMAQNLVGPGVIAFTCQFIEGTRDANRAGMMRMDMIIRHTDGGYVRIHPGEKIKNDATPKFPRRPEQQAVLQSTLARNGTPQVLKGL